jgi:hypothetical protein
MKNHINKRLHVAVITLVIACLVGAGSPARADHIVITAETDATIYSEDAATANGAGELWSGRTSGKLGTMVRRALLKFDVEGAIPAEAFIDSVVLKVTLTKANGESATSTFDLHQIQALWSEGPTLPTGGRGGAAQTGDVTWSHRIYDSDQWGQPGGDLAASADASLDISISSGEKLFTNVTMAATVQDWVDGVVPNHGWMIKVRDEGPLQTARRFASRDAATGAPSLEIWYTPKVPVEATSWGGIKSRYAQ